MNFPFFDGTELITNKPNQRIKLPPSQHNDRIQPANYFASPQLRNAVNVALLLGKPLLLTGEPGTGKTLLAYRLAWELGYDEPLKFETKSDSSAKSLFYHYNSLARFHDSQFGKTEKDNRRDGVEYITYNALGQAIINTQKKEKYAPYLPGSFEYREQQRSVVLIDEIDKASRDFPNDILNELEHLYFRVPELDNVKIEADHDFAPIVIITSNSEKSLPDAFLRRCIFHHIEFPDEDHLKKIVLSSLNKNGEKIMGETDSYIGDATNLFLKLRLPQNKIQKPPSTSELLLWIETLNKIFPNIDNPLREADTSQIIDISLSVLTKMEMDQEKAKKIIESWWKENTDSKANE